MKNFDAQHFMFEENRAGFEQFLMQYAGLEAYSVSGAGKIFDIYFKQDQEDYDAKWAQRLRRYVYTFTTRKQGMTDYTEFFGSPYLGLQKIVFTTADRNQWFSEIYDADEDQLYEELIASGVVKKEWHVVSDVWNMSVAYLLCQAYHSKNMDDKTKHQAMVDIICMYHYKCLTSIIANDYKFLARKEVAIETYNRLSLKYDIKRYGSWRALIEARAEFILDPRTGIHFDAYTTMKNDAKVVYMIGDIQDRLRGVINDINKVFHDVKNKTDILSIEGNTVNLEDGVTIKNVSKEVPQYKNYIESVLVSEQAFYKEELIRYACKIAEFGGTDKLAYVVRAFPGIYNSKKGAEPAHKFVDELTVHLFEYMRVNNILKTHVVDVARKMKGAYNSPRSVNETVLFLRQFGDELVTSQTGIRTPSTIISLRTAFLVYMCLRIITRDNYQ
jgi:hypothetical protein